MRNVRSWWPALALALPFALGATNAVAGKQPPPPPPPTPVLSALCSVGCAQDYADLTGTDFVPGAKIALTIKELYEDPVTHQVSWVYVRNSADVVYADEHGCFHHVLRGLDRPAYADDEVDSTLVNRIEAWQMKNTKIGTLLASVDVETTEEAPPPP